MCGCKKRKDLNLGKKRCFCLGLFAVISVLLLVGIVMGFVSGRIFGLGVNKTTCAIGSLWDTTIDGYDKFLITKKQKCFDYKYQIKYFSTQSNCTGESNS